MYSSFSPYPFFSFIIIIIINFLSNLPVSFSALLNPHFLNCSRPFNCGIVKNVFYPFWGHGRADYCGLPGYQLKCEDGSPEIVIESQSYRILYINESGHSLRIATMDSWSANCPTQFHNISPSFSPFAYIPTFNQYITLFYGCPSYFVPPNKFSCSVNDTDNNYYWVDSTGVPPLDFPVCNHVVTVPVLQTRFPSFTSFQSTLEHVLKEGFDVGYTMYVSFCNGCLGSGGQCGYNLNTAPTCFCYDGPYQERYCPTRQPKGSNTAKKAMIDDDNEDDYPDLEAFHTRGTQHGPAVTGLDDNSHTHVPAGSQGETVRRQGTSALRKRKKMRTDDIFESPSIRELSESIKIIAQSFSTPDIPLLNEALRSLPNSTDELVMQGMDILGENGALAKVFIGIEPGLRLKWLERKIKQASDQVAP